MRKRPNTSAQTLSPIALCRDITDLLDKLDEGAGVAAIAEEALRSHLSELAARVSKQPTWSDFPFVVLTSGHLYARSDAHRIKLLGSSWQLLATLGNSWQRFSPRTAALVTLSSTVKAGLQTIPHARSAEERLRLFIEHAPAALVMLDWEMRYLAVSQRWMKMPRATKCRVQ